MHIVKLNTKQRQQQKPSPKILDLLEQIQEGIHPLAITIPDYTLFVAPYNRTNEWRTYYRDENNTRHQIQTKTANLREAQQIVKSKIISEVIRVAKLWDLLPKEFTLSSLFDKYIAQMINDGHADSTIKEYRTLKKFLIETYGDISVSDFTLTTHAQDFVNKGRKDVVEEIAVVDDVEAANPDKEEPKEKRIPWGSSATIGKHVRHAHATWEYGLVFHKQHVLENIWAQVRLPKPDNLPKTDLSESQFMEILHTIGTSTYAKRRLIRICVLSILLGNRIKELLRLTNDRIDRERMTVLIANTVNHRTKTNKNRIVDICKFFLKVVDDQILDNIRDGRKSGFIFPNLNNGSIGYYTVHEDLYKDLLVGMSFYVKGMGFHTFRRFFSTGLDMNGAFVRDIQLYLGHENSKVTEKYLGIVEGGRANGKMAIAKHTDKVKNMMGDLMSTTLLPPDLYAEIRGQLTLLL